MDHPYADPPGLDNAVDVLQRPNVIRQRSSFWTYLCPELGCLPLTLLFWMHLQAVDHIYVLTVVFTALVIIAATQGNAVHRSALSGASV